MMKSLLRAFLFISLGEVILAFQSTLDVEFEYQLEVDHVGQASTTSSATDVMNEMKEDLLRAIQVALPNGSLLISDSATGSSDIDPIHPSASVHFSSIESHEFSKCFTGAQDCSLIRSTITVTYEGNKPRQSLRFVTLRLVQRYLEYYSSKKDHLPQADESVVVPEEPVAVTTTYQYPTLVTTLSQFQIRNASNYRMNQVEIEVLEDSFVEVFGAIVFALEGDTEISDAHFVYQDLRSFPSTSVSTSSSKIRASAQEDETLFQIVPTTNSSQAPDEIVLQVDLVVRGICRKCTAEAFGDVVNRVIGSNLVAFETKLGDNGRTQGTDYFEDIDSIAYAVPELPQGLPPTEVGDLYDMEAPMVNERLPWFLWFGVTVAHIVVAAAIYLFCCVDPDFYDKENHAEQFSTSDSGESRSVAEEDIISEEGSEAFDQAAGFSKPHPHTPTFRRIEGTGDIVSEHHYSPHNIEAGGRPVGASQDYEVQYVI